MDAVLQELPLVDCLRLLRAGSVGRIAVIERGYPIVLPVNYRLVEAAGRTRIAVRTRTGSMMDRASMHVAFEIDGIDRAHHLGWSVVVRGHLEHVDPEAFELRTRFDPAPWAGPARDVWLLIESFVISGRQLRPPELDWALAPTPTPRELDRAEAPIPQEPPLTPSLALVGQHT